MNKKPFSLIILLLCSAYTSVSFSQDTEFKGGTANTQLHLSNGELVRINITTIDLDHIAPYKEAVLWGGDSIEEPKRVVSKIEVQVGDKQTHVPFSGYSDLGDPGVIMVKETEDGFNMTIFGSDAAGSYTAVLMFKRINGIMLLYHRRVASGEFPELFWQDTTYSYVTNIK